MYIILQKKKKQFYSSIQSDLIVGSFRKTKIKKNSTETNNVENVFPFAKNIEAF